MSTRALHISHTDIRSDSRILKEVAAISRMPEMQVLAIGVEDKSSAPASNSAAEFKVATICLITRRLRRLPRPAYLFLAFGELTTRLVIQGFRFRPNVIHCHDTLVLPAGVFLKLITGASIIYDAHELESQKNGQTAFLSWVTLMIERACWPWVDGLVSVSGSIVDWYQSIFPKRPTAVVLNSPVFSNRSGVADFTKSKHFRDAFDIQSDALIFLYVGIISRGRGIDLLLDVFSNLEGKAHIVFMGYGELSGEILHASEVSKNIHLHPPVAHNLVVDYASGADIGLCLIENISLSDYYCLPNKLFEYSFAGIPVLGSDFPEIKRVVEQFSLGKVCRPDRDAVRQAVLAFIESPPSRVSASHLSPLTWDHQAQLLISLYKQLLPAQSHSA